MATTQEKLIQVSFAVILTGNGFQNLKSVSIRDNSIVRFELKLAVRQSDGTNRAIFKRTGLFYRQGGGPVQIQGPTWHTDQTIRSDRNMDVKFILGSTGLQLQARNAGAVSTRWQGQIYLIVVN